MTQRSSLAPCLILMLALASCGSDADPPPPPRADAPPPAAPLPKGSPEDTVRLFLSASRTAPEKGILHLTKRAGQAYAGLLARGGAPGGVAVGSVASFDVLDHAITGRTARVTARVTDDRAENSREGTLVFFLKPEEGHWKIYRFGDERFQIDFENLEASMAEAYGKAASGK